MNTSHNIPQKCIWIYVTEIATSAQLKTAAKTLNREPAVIRWSIDIEDIDNVLRVESNSLGEYDIPMILENHGLICTPMSD